MRRLNPQVLRRQPEVQERQRLQRAERQAAVLLEQVQEQEQQELVPPQEPPALRELLQVLYQPWAQPSQALE